MSEDINAIEEIASIEEVAENAADELPEETTMEDAAIEGLSEQELQDVCDKIADSGKMNTKRTIHELETLADSMDWDENKDDIEQVTGSYKDIKGTDINGETGEAHHLIPQSILDYDKNAETAILLEKPDHRELPTTGGSINSRYTSFMPDMPDEGLRLRDEIKELIDKGEYAESFRNELLEIRKNEYDKSVAEYQQEHPGEEPSWEELDFSKYDEASNQAILKEIERIKKDGIPPTK